MKDPEAREPAAPGPASNDPDGRARECRNAIAHGRRGHPDGCLPVRSRVARASVPFRPECSVVSCRSRPSSDIAASLTRRCGEFRHAALHFAGMRFADRPFALTRKLPIRKSGPSPPDAAQRPGDVKGGDIADRAVRQLRTSGQSIPRPVEAQTGDAVRGTNAGSTTDAGRAVTRIFRRANQAPTPAHQGLPAGEDGRRH